jgi:hypothetical protein
VSQVPERRGPDRQVRYGRIVGLVFCVIGFVAIGLGWNGMARVACPDCQLPYLLSGGAAGLGFIVLGSTLLLAAQIRDDRIKLADQLRDVGTTLSRATSAAAGPGGAETVVAGKSTYHLPTCRLVEGKADVDLVSVEVARLQGLSPCRVCNPPAPGNGNAQSEPGEKAKATSGGDKPAAKSPARK